MFKEGAITGVMYRRRGKAKEWDKERARKLIKDIIRTNDDVHMDTSIYAVVLSIMYYLYFYI